MVAGERGEGLDKDAIIQARGRGRLGRSSKIQKGGRGRLGRSKIQMGG